MTDDNKKDQPSDDALKFFGIITASVTHELNNILSIIDQSAGLVEDFMANPDSGVPLTEEKLKQITAKIRKNSQRGIGFIKHLNSFAHSTDEPGISFNANTMLENWAALTKRFADLKAVGMELNLPEEQIEIDTDAYLVRKILYYALKEILSTAQKNDIIKIILTADDPDAVINMEGILSDTGAVTDNTYLENMTAVSGGSLKIETEDTGIKYCFRFPIKK
ncbi:MAG: hypothetical protein DRP46_00810 [Candidatus Zixiibacteriota bacterium]|nr:MAG: hypothetical protein DRP46_00810 [candidate division Zixibacteria bacterium]